MLYRDGGSRPYTLQSHNGEKSDVPDFYLIKMAAQLGIDENELRAELGVPLRPAAPKLATEDATAAKVDPVSDSQAKAAAAQAAAEKAVADQEQADAALWAELEAESTREPTMASESLSASTGSDVAAISEPADACADNPTDEGVDEPDKG